MEQEGQAICQEKIDQMRKYVPFLEDFIKKLKKESENIEKISRMEFLYEALAKTPTRISLDDFKECQKTLTEVLQMINVVNDNQQTDSEEPHIQFTEDKSSIKSTNIVQDDFNVEQVECKGIINEANESNKSESDGEQLECANGLQLQITKSIQETIEPSNCTRDIQTLSNSINIEEQQDKDAKFKKSKDDSHHCIGLQNKHIGIGPSVKTGTDEHNINHEKNEMDSKDQKASESLQRSNSKDEHYSKGGEDNENTLNIREQIETDNESEIDEEQEGVVELINVPEEAEEIEMILPDSVDEIDHAKESSDEEADENESMSREDFDGNDSKAVSTSEDCSEHENQREEMISNQQVIVVNEENNELHSIFDPTMQQTALVNTEKESNEATQPPQCDYDPLHCEDTSTQAHETPMTNDLSRQQEIQVSEKLQPVNDENDDDDVQIIETRNSPICIESDEDDENSAKRIESVSPLLIPITQTTKHQDVSNINVNTIEVLDSSDDESQIQPTKKATSKSAKILQKRTLLPHQKKIIKETVKTISKASALEPCKHVAPEKTSPAINFISTPQSNFLNAFNLQPTKPGENPPAFSAKLLNKDVIIPNAFYGNPARSTAKADKPTIHHDEQRSVCIPSVSQQLERAWLDNFVKCFTNPQQVVSHTCYVLLQQVLKYKVFIRIKDLRTALNAKTSQTTSTVDIKLLQELRNAFYNGKQISELGRRFCVLACSVANNSTVTLTSDTHTGWVTSRTCTLEEMRNTNSANGDFSCTTTGVEAAASTSSGRKRYTEDDEYTPGKLSQLTFDGELSGERRKSLRTQRTRRYDKSFSYNEDEIEDFETEENLSYAAVKRKVEQKRLEAQLQRQRQAKSFENAFLEMFAKNDHRRATPSACGASTVIAKHKQKSSETTIEHQSKKRTRNMNETLIVLDDDDDILELDGEPKQHRIYKVIPTQLLAASTKRSESNNCSTETNREIESTEVITCDDLEDSNDVVPLQSNVCVHPSIAPKNINTDIHATCQNNEWCILCQRRVTRIVHHYVNEHRGCEVYVSRLSSTSVRRLRRNQNNIAQISLYKNGQQQYESYCVFCEKMSRFMQPYWYQHFTMHTGEYAYRCSGCGVRKPTRSLLTAHINQPCPKGGELLQDYHYDSKATQIEARICTLCNYVQLHRHNIVHHLRTQHNIRQILPKHIERLVLLKTTQPEPQSSHSIEDAVKRPRDNTAWESTQIDDSSSSDTRTTSQYIHTNYDNSYTTQAGLWDDNDPGDDLSFMICGMLDVQMDAD